LCTPAIFTALEQATVNGNCSLSDGMRILAAKRKLRAFDIGDAIWQDVDTPEALTFGTNIFGNSYEPNQVLIEAARV
jgi:NDP-sugar pyrophosphorylase family protein